ncbi:MAG: TetR family transcriptional regulator [Alysiella sp.]|uniref:TetR family transcriptional regulator n=1 Tax=Alysiella sp. TaxID=1872483 RepID=UPI0026DBDBDC|nr:TetR family transcriptional regulator [Alysiella sp.]MDO4434633.1 TetR family transcriptional regulator [Alysiella sp.]
MRKTREEAEKTRQQLLDAALDVFWLHGVSHATLQEIAQNAGVTRGALYWHFKNKEDLFEVLFEQCYTPFLQKLQTAAQQPEQALTHLRGVFCELFDLLENDTRQQKFCNVMHLKCEHTPKNAPITKLAENYHHRFHEEITRILLLAQQQNSLPENIDIDKITLYLKSNITGLILLWSNKPENIKLSEMGQMIVDTTIHTLQNSPQFLKQTA